ncbi:Retrotransposon-derived protein PEG10 [Rhizoctonia solani]|uniref:Retrotransposon-derived protein PEG10 n=1 Tax=Rhizoctonia solani TaxID=456999 RepID=A0A8H8P2U5_9AGAM|nr:Retrotransposon-derived protein PEG10 [Rhizoctonia solani]QRW22911.1 Retrotransposon-derived protein PEG10 [Rhizoctonia solani]
MELNWNNTALHSQLCVGFIGKSKTDCHMGEATCTLRELPMLPSSLTMPSARREPATRNRATKTSPLSSNPNYVLEEEHNCCHAEGLCVKCSKPGHMFAKCRTGWKATPKEDKGKAKETAKTGKDSKYQLGKE